MLQLSLMNFIFKKGHRDHISSKNLIPNLIIDSGVEKYILSFIPMSNLFSLRTTSNYWNHIILEYLRDFAKQNPEWVTLFLATLFDNLNSSTQELRFLQAQLRDETSKRRFMYTMLLSFGMCIFPLLHICVLIGGSIVLQSVLDIGEGSRYAYLSLYLFGGAAISGIVCLICGGCTFVLCLHIMRVLDRYIFHKRLMTEINQQKKTIRKMKQNITEWKRRLSIV